jgi:hypothetical protein
MFGIFGNEKPSPLDKQIASVLNDMDEYGPDSPEYPKLLKHLDKLYKMKARDRRQHVSPDTLANVAGTLLSVLIIVGYERAHVMASKALGFGVKRHA